MPARRHVKGSPAGGEKVEMTAEVEDMAYLGKLMDAIRHHAHHVQFNKQQSKILSDRCGSIHRTLAMMSHTTPSPNVLSAFRSAEYLLRRHCSADGWEAMMLHRFTAVELFEAAREKIRLVWSLQSTARWEQEDAAAEQADGKANLALMRERGILPEIALPHPSAMVDARSEAAAAGVALTQEQLVAQEDEHYLGYFARRRVSGWKLPFSELQLRSVMEPTTTPPAAPLPPLSPLSAGPTSTSAADAEVTEDREEDDIGAARKVGLALKHFQLSNSNSGGGRNSPPVRYRWHSTAVQLYELTNPQHISPTTLENFIVDMKCRYSWSHPGVVRCVGGFAERFDENDLPYLSLGAVVDDVTAQGFVSLDELLFHRGRRFSLSTAIQIVLDVADAVQYCVFSHDDVAPEVADHWALVSPSNVFLRLGETRPQEDGAGREEGQGSGGGGANDSVQPDGKEHFEIAYLPGFYVEEGDLSRWTPPQGACNRHCYSLAQLMIAILGNCHPFASITTQSELCKLRGGSLVTRPRGDDQLTEPTLTEDGHLLHEVDGIDIPKGVPRQVQEFLTMAFRHHRPQRQQPAPVVHHQPQGFLSSLAGKMIGFGVSTDVAEDDGPVAFFSVQHFRRELFQLLRSPAVQSLPSGRPTPPVAFETEDHEHQQKQQGKKQPSTPWYVDIGPREAYLNDYGYLDVDPLHSGHTNVLMPSGASAAARSTSSLTSAGDSAAMAGGALTTSDSAAAATPTFGGTGSETTSNGVFEEVEPGTPFRV